MSPTATEIVDFFKDAMKENRTVGRNELLSDNFSPPVNAGISCLAALPSQVQELIPEPYNRLSNAAVEEIYASCMDPGDNCFDMKQFELRCEERIKEAAQDQDVDLKAGSEIQIEQYGRHGRRILTGDHYWTVLFKQKTPLTHPFDPPPPFSDRLSELRPNRRLKVTRKMATAEPRPRSVWSTSKPYDHVNARDDGEHIVRHISQEVKHSDLGDLLKAQDGRDMSILDVEYKHAYSEFRRRKNKKRREKMHFDLDTIPGGSSVEVNGERPPTNNNKKETKKKKERIDFDVAARMRDYKLVLPPSEPPTNVEGYTPLLLLNQLSDAQMIGKVVWNYAIPSVSSYASIDPHGHESVQLIVRKGARKDKSVLSEDLTYGQDRDINQVSKKSLKQHLSLFALCDILGPQVRWSEMSFKEIKDYLLQSKTKPRESKKA